MCKHWIPDASSEISGLRTKLKTRHELITMLPYCTLLTLQLQFILLLLSLVHPCRFTHCNQFNFWWPVQNPHLHLHWWTCYNCHLEKKWACDKYKCYPPADQEISWSCWWYLPDSAHHWPISGSEWHCGDIQLHSGECQGRVFRHSVYCTRWVELIYTLPFLFHFLVFILYIQLHTVVICIVCMFTEHKGSRLKAFALYHYFHARH